jgi:hypothetical protein
MAAVCWHVHTQHSHVHSRVADPHASSSFSTASFHSQGLGTITTRHAPEARVTNGPRFKQQSHCDSASRNELLLPGPRPVFPDVLCTTSKHARPCPNKPSHLITNLVVSPPWKLVACHCLIEALGQHVAVRVGDAPTIQLGHHPSIDRSF